MDGEAVEAGQDLRGALVEAFAKAKEPEVNTEPEVKVEAKVETKPEGDRARDEAGRFVKQDEKQPETKTDGKAADWNTSQLAKVPETKSDIKETPAKVPAPPNSWSAEAKAKWHELSPEVIAAIAAREQDFGKSAGKMDEERALGRDVQKVFQPYMPLLQAENTTPIAAVQSLLNTAYILRQGTQEQKAQAVIATCRQHGIDLSKLAAPSGSADTQVSPELVALRQEVAQLRDTFSTREQQSQGALDAQVKQEIEAFSADPANVHYEEVKADMAALLRAERAKDLKTAYDMACWARPDVRSSILAQQRAQDEATRKEQEKQRAEEARRKGISITGAPGSTAGATASPERSLRDELQANMAAARGAV